MCLVWAISQQVALAAPKWQEKHLHAKAVHHRFLLFFYYDEKLLQHFLEIVRLEKRSASDILPKSISIVLDFAAAKNASELKQCFRNYAQRVKLDLIRMLLKLLSVLSPWDIKYWYFRAKEVLASLRSQRFSLAPSLRISMRILGF